MMTLTRAFRMIVASAVATIAIVSCGGDLAPDRPSVQFVLDAPSCNAGIGLEFRIDAQIVGSDTLKNGESSVKFYTSTGRREILAKTIAFQFVSDTVVTLSSAQEFVYHVPVGC